MTESCALLQSADGFVCPAWCVRPEGAPRGGMVVLPEIFGVNAHIRAVTARFAARGYAAVAPDTFARVQAGVALGYGDEDVAQGRKLKAAVERLPEAWVLGDIQAAIDHAAALCGGKVGLVGFCWGGLLAWRAACELQGLAAVVCYYGGGMTSAQEVARTPRCPVLAHFGAHDAHISQPSVQAFARAHPEVQVQLYDAGHGFNCDQRASYDEAAAQTARERSLALLARCVG
ncbi:MAG: dienelactone hydrolase family protein [Burkholderiaceae bacterium]|jgi:carboxymethylenebutenolidase|nr:dienelactone hydrolase family protein [Burkholderiaceae bacterium]MCO5103946.1 dienelactone hydrolase family protein [Burkholderiaceae bacterium]